MNLIPAFMRSKAPEQKPAPPQENFLGAEEKSSITFGAEISGTKGTEHFTPESVFRAFRTVVYIRTAVSLIADAVAQIPLQILREDTDGNLVEQYRVRNPLFRSDLFENPSPFFTYQDWVSKLVMDYLLFGNAYNALEIDRGKSEAYALEGSKIEIVKDPKIFVSEYRYTGDVATVRYRPLQVAHIRNNQIEDLYFGQSPIESIVKEVSSLEVSNKFIFDYFKNSARPDGILMTEQYLSQAIRDKMRAEWRRLHSYATGGAGNVAILSNGLQYKQTQNSVADADIDNIDTVLARRVATAFRIPLLFFANSQNVNFSTSSNVIRMFYRMAVRPILAKIEGALTKQVRAFYQDNKLNVKFSIQDVPGLVENLDSYSKVLINLHGEGIITSNEARGLLNKVSRMNLSVSDDPLADRLIVRVGGSPFQNEQETPQGGGSPGQPQQDTEAPRREGPDNNSP